MITKHIGLFFQYHNQFAIDIFQGIFFSNICIDVYFCLLLYM